MACFQKRSISLAEKVESYAWASRLVTSGWCFRNFVNCLCFKAPATIELLEVA